MDFEQTQESVEQHPEEQSAPIEAQPQPSPPPPPLPYPGFWQGLFLFLILFAVQVITVLPFAVVAYVTSRKALATHPLVLGIATTASAFAVVYVARYWTRNGPMAILRWIPLRAGTLAWSASLTAGHLVAGLVLVVWISRLLPGNLPKIDYGMAQSKWISAFLLVVAAPLCEEMVFRGVLLPGFAARYGAWRGISLSALLFGLAHGSFIRIPYTFVLGVITGWLRMRTGSVWPGIVAHAFNNGVVAVALVASPATSSAGKPAIPPFSWGEVAIMAAGLWLTWLSWKQLCEIFDRQEAAPQETSPQETSKDAAA